MAPPSMFKPFLLSAHSLLSACFLLSTYLLAVQSYKRMRLTTSIYGMSFGTSWKSSWWEWTVPKESLVVIFFEQMSTKQGLRYEHDNGHVFSHYPTLKARILTTHSSSSIITLSMHIPQLQIVFKQHLLDRLLEWFTVFETWSRPVNQSCTVHWESTYHKIKDTCSWYATSGI